MAGTSMSRFALEFAKQKGLLPNKKPQQNTSRSKYNAKRMQVGDHKFDSTLEGMFYQRLYVLLKAKKIVSLDLQPEYLLHDGFIDNRGISHEPIFYRGDFKVVFPDGTEKIFDTKGVKTEEYRIKKKMLLFRYPELNFEEVYEADSHPVQSAILTVQQIQEFEKKAAAKTAMWKSRNIKKTM